METITDRTVIYDGARASAGLNASAVSWGAVVGGAVTAAAMSLILFVLGTGLGLTSVSPWAHEGVDAGSFGIAAIAWIIFVSLASSALGGYLAGRLRTRWLEVPRDEVYFRDTAHGFLAWALASLLTASLLFGAITSVIGAGASAVTSVAEGVGNLAGATATAGGAAASGLLQDEGGTLSYHLDALFRPDPAATPAPTPATPPPAPPAEGDAAAADPAAAPQQAQPASNNAPTNNAATVAATPPQPAAPALDEVSRIITRAYRRGDLAAEDVTYIGQLVASHTGLDQQEAEARVRTAYDNLSTELREMETAAREAADTARVTSAYISLWCFVALLAGAFSGSLAATWGGRQRDL